MSFVPLVSGRDVAKTLVRMGWEIVRQHGSYIILVRGGHPATLSVPDYREVARGTLRGILRRAEITPEEFVANLK